MTLSRLAVLYVSVGESRNYRQNCPMLNC